MLRPQRKLLRNLGAGTAFKCQGFLLCFGWSQARAGQILSFHLYDLEQLPMFSQVQRKRWVFKGP